MKETILIEFNNEEKRIRILLDAGRFNFSTSLYPQDAWLLLYLLKPEWDGWREHEKNMCEHLLAIHHTIGVMKDKSRLFVQLPTSHFEIPVVQEVDLADALADKLSQISVKNTDNDSQQGNEREERLMFADNHLSCTFRICSLVMEGGHLSPIWIRKVFQIGISLSNLLYTKYCELSHDETKKRSTTLMRYLCSIDPAFDKLMWLIEPESLN
jgi:hypothetical protein